ncbi:MAG: hypothetical protein IPL61_15820 [Myxococcales bacterium]|nr:hypothetical protein [Myxococcales bacterium]
MHRVNLWWAGHAVHHQSDHLNLPVAIRIGWFSVYTSWVFYPEPLALVGVTARGVAGRARDQPAVPVPAAHALDREARLA